MAVKNIMTRSIAGSVLEAVSAFEHGVKIY